MKTKTVQRVSLAALSVLLLVALLFAGPGIGRVTASAASYISKFNGDITTNFEDYFTITTSAEYRGNTVTISYSIKPKSTAYAADSSSSSSITVKLRGGVYPYSFSTSPTYSSTETITLYKSSGYKKSGTITVYVSSGADEIYWGTDVTSASGTIYK